MDPNERAAKNWLSSLGKERPWLLIVDNADELGFPVEELFPDSDSGFVLVTTRNPMLRLHGTVGPRSYHFDELGETDSIELLLRAADEPLPWSQLTLESAEKICKTLGYLPLALTHAGKVILARWCTLENYLSFFEKNWDRIRKSKSIQGNGHITDANAAIYSSYELIHDAISAKGTQASTDALDLLKVFAFLHRQRIRMDIFTYAASNPDLESQEQQRRILEEKSTNTQAKPKKAWDQTLRGLTFQFLSIILNLGYRPVLPRLLSDALVLGSFDELRLREALNELSQFSLIFPSPDPRDDYYSMHPAVHLWVRERPEMTIGDQAVWCQATATILTQAILVPPLGDKEYDEILRRDLLPHVSYVQSNEHVIRAKFLANQKPRRRMWPVLQPRFDKAQAIQLVKFSLVYAQCGLLEEAERLQLQVKDFCVRTLGIEHTSTMDIMLLLSRTYLTRGDDAADLQQRVLDTCIRVRGKDDLKTLKVMDMLGSSRLLQGRIAEARGIHERAVEGLKKVHGDTHVDTLRAMGNLGRAVSKDFRFTKAIKIHTDVLSGLCKQLGESHLDTLVAMDNLAMAYFDRAGFGYGRTGDLDKAVKLEQEVWEERREKLGKEHLFSLWAGLNLARIKALRGEIDDALAIFLPGHEIAIRNLGETHFAVLFGKMHYGRILTYAKRYKEAEEILQEVVDSHDGPRHGHPDRLFAIFSLIKCRNMLGKQSETDALMQEITAGTKALFGEHHPWVSYLLDPVNLCKEPDEELDSPIESIIRVDSGIGGPMKMKPVALIAKYGHIYT